MNKIEFTRTECRKANIKYQIKNDALFILAMNPYTGKNQYKQVCFNLYNLSFEQITNIIYESAGKIAIANQLDKISR